VLAVIEQIAAIMLKVTEYVIALAPLAVFTSIAATVATQGLGVLSAYAKFIGGFYAALVVLWIALLAAAGLVIGGARLSLCVPSKIPPCSRFQPPLRRRPIRSFLSGCRHLAFRCESYPLCCRSDIRSI